MITYFSCGKTSTKQLQLVKLKYFSHHIRVLSTNSLSRHSSTESVAKLCLAITSRAIPLRGAAAKARLLQQAARGVAAARASHGGVGTCQLRVDVGERHVSPRHSSLHWCQRHHRLPLDTAVAE